MYMYMYIIIIIIIIIISPTSRRSEVDREARVQDADHEPHLELAPILYYTKMYYIIVL